MSQPTARTTESKPTPVPLLDLTQQFETLREEMMEAIERVMASGRYILGPEVEAFEREVADYCGVPHAVGCASGTDALVLALRAVGVGPGDEVVTPAYSFVASASSVALVGAKPVFCDVEPDTYNLDPVALERVLTPRTKAVIAVHLFGQCADMDRITTTCESHGVPVIEDAAQAIGAEWRGRRAGAWGAAACFSFFPSKNLGGAGDGGLVTCRDEEVASRLRRLRGHGAQPKYHHLEIGFNSRLDALQAAVLRVKLRHLDGWAEGRRRNADTYREKLAGARVSLPVARPEARHVYNQFVVRSPARDALRDHLKAGGIGTEIYYPGALSLQPCFAELGHRAGDFPVSEAAAHETLALPIYPELTVEQIGAVVDRVREFVPT